MKILVINAGSSSMKYQLIDMENEEVLAKGNCERIGIDGLFSIKTADGRKAEREVSMPNHTVAFKVIEEAITSGECKVIDDLKEISAVGHRIVQGGAIFKESCLVNDKVLSDIEDLAALAPLHNKAHGMGIRACIEALGKDVPQVVVFDTAFHSTMPPEAYMFAVPYEYYEKYQIRRYGFHGTSHRFVSGELAKRLGKNIEDLKIITCHLGNGSSLAAIKGGKVIDTTMGLTPLDGCMMGTRSGSLDPSVVTFIAEKENLSASQMSDLLNKKSGVFGISGVSSDDRDVTKAAKEGNERAALAQKMQRYQIKKLIGSFAAALDGVDAIVFTGGLGENVYPLRKEICDGLSYLGVKLDYDKNDELIRGKDGTISTPDSKVVVEVIMTNEELVIARDTKAIVEAL
ncbi:MAG: acetate kinase [Oscillospiraceae bacterium]|nr:acetate kinase [Oscillospiraceae bacterium]